MDRRTFLTASAAAMTSLSALSAARAADRPNDSLRVAVMGVNGRGKDHVRGFSAFNDVEVSHLIDPDENTFAKALEAVNPRQKQPPKLEKDVRRVLDDKTVDAIAIAAPDHWHALATVWACQAGKHVYVEKPVSHNLIEGRRMVEAARKYNRVVQAGTQRRSVAYFQSARDFVRSGKLGKVPFVRTCIAGNRPSIGHAADESVPRGVDYDLWLGPAAQRPFNPNRFHYKWHWNWDYGTGELGNNGIHALDVVRMLLDLDAPHRVSGGGGKLVYDDDQETPDTMVATFDFDSTCVVWEHRVWSKTGFAGESWGVALYGEKGTLVFDKKGWHVSDGDEASDRTGEMERAHLRNFLDCVKSGKRPCADVEEGHKSARLCHLGNVAFRVGRALRFDAKTETVLDDAEANKLLGRTHRKPYTSSLFDS